uniref:hypothetical protein n=1 Tax=Mariniflexile sp. TaxID=1979402 RepID=UPI0040483A03
MTNPKQKMSASYKAIFILSIFMVFFVLIAGALTKSKSSGFGMWIWGYTAWLMYKRRNADLVSFYKGLLWFDVIAAGIALSVLTFSEGDVGRYVGYTAVEAALLFALVILFSYGLYIFFRNQTKLLSVSSSVINDSSIDDKHWEQASHELDGDRHVATWARAIAESNGDESKAKAVYLKIRAGTLHGLSEKSILENSNIKEPKLDLSSNKSSSWDMFEVVALIGFVIIVGSIVYAVWGS